jgi:hypothetical protein
MSDFKDRLVQEEKDLKEKTGKLIDFINSDNFQKVDPKQKFLLRIQSKAMQTYLECISTRIEDL